MDWRRNAVDVVAGVRSRRAVIVAALLAGVVLASATLPAQRTVLHHGGHRHHHELSGAPGQDVPGRTLGYFAPTTLKVWLTKMWWGQLTPMLWTSYSPLLSFTTRSTTPPG
jgi:hypothetical protein